MKKRLSNKDKITQERIDSLLSDLNSTVKPLTHNDSAEQEKKGYHERIVSTITQAFVESKSRHFLETKHEFDLNDEIFVQIDFLSFTSIVLTLYCLMPYTKKYNWETRLGGFRSEGRNGFKIGWIDIHKSETESCQLFIRSKLTKFFLGPTSHILQPADDLFKTLLKVLEFPRNVTYQIHLEIKSKEFYLINRSDVIY